MTKQRAMRLAAKWAAGGVCTLTDGEAQEYHQTCLEALKESDTAVEAEWVPEQDGGYVCSACKTIALSNSCEYFFTPRCPYCGAYMKNGD